MQVNNWREEETMARTINALSYASLSPIDAERSPEALVEDGIYACFLGRCAVGCTGDKWHVPRELL
jgi:hypothetical protein